MQHRKYRDVQHTPQQFNIERSELAQCILLDIYRHPSINHIKHDRHRLRHHRSDSRSFYSQFRKAAVTEYQQVVQQHIRQRHHNSIQCQHLRPGNTDKQSTEHHIHKREKEPEHTPVQEFFRGIQNRIGRNQYPHNIPGKQT